jgi:hypothetical protein
MEQDRSTQVSGRLLTLCVLRCGRMLLDKVSERLLEFRCAGEIASFLRPQNVVDDHPLDQQLTVGAMNDAAAELDREHRWQMLVLGDRQDLVLRQIAKGEAILKR